MNARLITMMNYTKDGEKEMFEILNVIEKINHFCLSRMCYECPFDYEHNQCNIASLAELLADDPCMWDMDAIEKVLNREVDSNH